jgi:hypothetical protein
MNLRITAVAVAALCLPLAVAAQTSPLYLGDWEGGHSWIVQEGKVIGSFDRVAGNDGPGLAVTDTIKYIGRDSGAVGHQYTLDGAPLDGTYTNPEFESLYDGATDGRTRNWSIAHNDFDPPQFAVVVGDQDWNGLAAAFAPLNRSSGITYDANTDTLWVTNTLGGGTAVQQYTTDGTLLSEFPIQIPGAYGMAWDPADDTLWVVESFGQPQLHQFAKDGQFLQTLLIPELNSTVLGAEFSMRVGDECYPDFTGEGELDLFDFLEYVNAFNAGEDRADCTGEGDLDFFDFLCFTNAFNEGC